MIDKISFVAAMVLFCWFPAQSGEKHPFTRMTLIRWAWTGLIVAVTFISASDFYRLELYR